MKQTKIINQEDFIGVRLDRVLSKLFNDYSREYMANLISQNLVLVNNKVAKASYRVRNNDEIIVDFPEIKTLETKAQDLPLDIIYEDDDIIVINKARGVVVHPAVGHYEGTLVNALLNHCTDLSGINGVKRPGIVHRIDKDTTGLLVVAKNDLAHEFLANQLKDHSMYREYLALVKGVISEDKCQIIAPIGRDKYNRQKMAVDLKNGKEAITYVEVIKRYNQYTLVKCILKTGRTHQIRVHMNYIKHPLEGDLIYGNKKNILFENGQLLHAYKLHLIHPKTKKTMEFEAPLPSDFSAILHNLDALNSLDNIPDTNSLENRIAFEEKRSLKAYLTKDYQHYDMKLDHISFLNIKNGIKTIEMRLEDEKRSLLAVGDYIDFIDLLTNEIIKTRIKKLYHYNNFEDLYANFKDKRKLGYCDNQTANPDDMLKYYSKQQIEIYGVLGIEIEII